MGNSKSKVLSDIDFISQIEVVNGNVGDYLTPDYVVSDPAGEYYIKSGNGRGAGGASGCIYNIITDGNKHQFKFKIKTLKTGNASGVLKYTSRYNDVFLIHGIGPMFDYDSFDSSIIELKNVYKSVFESYATFIKSCKYPKTLILMAISSGIFSGPKDGKFSLNKHHYTTECIKNAYNELDNSLKKILTKSNIKLVEFNKKDATLYSSEFKKNDKEIVIEL